MYQNSKIEARCEAVRLAAIIKDVTSDNLIEMAKTIEGYILGDIDLPDVYDPNAYMKDLTEKIALVTSQRTDNKTPGVDPNLIKTLADA